MRFMVGAASEGVRGGKHGRRVAACACPRCGVHRLLQVKTKKLMPSCLSHSKSGSVTAPVYIKHAFPRSQTVTIVVHEGEFCFKKNQGAADLGSRGL